MDWLILAIFAQIIFGTSAVFDKRLLTKGFFDPWVYTFWFGILGLFALILLPFGSIAISAKVFWLALITGILFDLSALCLYLALAKSEASRIFPFAGGILPIFTFLFSFIFLGQKITLGDYLGFFLLLFGGFLFFRLGEKESRYKNLILVLLSSVFLGLSNVLTKIVFDGSDFIAGFFWIKMGGVVFSLAFFLVPSFWKKIWVSAKEQRQDKSHSLFFYNRAYASLGSLLTYFAISIGHPALIDVTQSFKYVIIFITGWFLIGEKFHGTALFKRIVATLFVLAGLVFLGINGYYQSLPARPDKEIIWGVTFSKKFSQELGLDWQKNYQAILDELKPKRIRLVAYWDEIEKQRGAFNFSDLDWQIEKLNQTKTKVILAVGMKVPRWPECHIPEWARSLDTETREEFLRTYIANVVDHYKNNKAVIVWQVENEPYLVFGECPERGENFLDKEIAVVKSLDTRRQVLITDGGEFGLWYKSVNQGDIFGTTMYRKVYSSKLSKDLGTFEYPISNGFFRIKEKAVRFITGEDKKPFIVAELQGEPWGPTSLQNMTHAEQMSYFDLDYFKETIKYAKNSGFGEYYLWGAEWWYWIKEKDGDASFWLEAQSVLK